MTNDQGKEALSRVLHVGLQEDSLISVASVNEKLVEGSLCTKLIVYKGEALLKGRKSNRVTGSLSI